MEKIKGGENLAKSKIISLTSMLTISLIVAMSFLQSVNAYRGYGSTSTYKVRRFHFNVYMWFSEHGPPGWAESDVEWLDGYNMAPLHWWGDPNRGIFPTEEHLIVGDKILSCHGDWHVECALPEYSGIFRYRWWIFWIAEEADDPGAKSLCGFFMFSHGTEDFEGMVAFGRASVQMDPGKTFPEGWQNHDGFMFGGP